MGRRALRAVDPALDLSQYLKAFDQLPQPLNGQELFGRRAPLEVEVGSGKGLFLRTTASRRPDIDFLGIEVSRKYARFAAAGLAKDRIDNAMVVVADAVRLFEELLPADCLAAVHVYFPDPWWKKRHARRRLMQSSFVGDLERTLAPGGVLHFWSDVEDYFQASLDVLAAHTGLEGPREVPERPAEHDMDFRTHFERRMRQHDMPVYRAEFRKPPPRVPSPSGRGLG